MTNMCKDYVHLTVYIKHYHRHMGIYYKNIALVTFFSYRYTGVIKRIKLRKKDKRV